MAKKYLDYDGLLYFWQKLKTTFAKTVDVPTKTSDLTNDSGYITSASIPSATTTTPKMDGTASVGSETKWAKGDHVHPSDTSRVPTTRKINGLDLTRDINIITKSTDVSTGGNKMDITTPTGSMHAYDADAIDGKMTYVSQQLAQVYVPKTTTVNGNALSGNITLDADDVSAIPTSAKGAASGVCPLDANSKVDSQYLPSYVDDVIEAYPVSGATELSAGWLSKTSGGSALTPEAGVIYVLMSDTTNYSENSQFRWATNTYVKLADGGVSSITNGEIDTIIAS